MNLLKRLLFLLFLWPLLAFGANPSYEAFIGTNGIIVTSNPPQGRVIIDGRNLTNGFSGGGGTGNVVFADLVWTNNVGQIYTLVDRPRIEFRTNQILGRMIRVDGTNTVLGSNALPANVLGEGSVAIGTDALGFVGAGNGSLANVAIGYQSSISNQGSFNVSIGYQSMVYNAFRSDNVAIGYQSMRIFHTGQQNTAVGGGTMDLLGTAFDGTALGWGAMDKLEGIGNTALGSAALLNAQGGGNNNVYVGHDAGRNSDRLDGNVVVGQLALATLDDFTNVVVIGNEATSTLTGLTNAVGIGALTRITADNQMMLGTNITRYVLRNVDYLFPSTNGLPGQVLTAVDTVNRALAWSNAPAGAAGGSGITNLFSPTLSNATIKPLVVGVGNAAGATNTTGEIRGLEAGSNITLTPNGSNYVIAATGGGGVGFSDLVWTNNGVTILPASVYAYTSNRFHFGSATTAGPRTNKFEWIPLTNSLRIGSVADINSSIRYIPTISNYWDFPFNNAANTYGFGSNILIQSVNSSILGGANNSISSNSAASVIVGGTNNFISTNSWWSFIGGGNNNEIHISSERSVIVGGLDNDVETLSFASFIGGGQGNGLGVSTGTGATYGTIGGGLRNRIRGGIGNVIAGGEDGVIITGSDYSSVVGGDGNQIGIVTTGSDWSFIGGGAGNGLDGDSHYSFIGGGQLNRIVSTAPHSAILGGYTNYLGAASGGSALIGSYSHISDSASNAFLIGVRITNATPRSVLIGANTGGSPTNSLHITGNATTNIGPFEVREFPGRADATLTLWQTNSRGYTMFTVTNSVISTNRLVWSLGSNTVAANDVFKVHSTTIADGINNIVVTNAVVSGVGATGITNIFTPSLSNATIVPLVVGVGNAAGATNSTGEIRGLEAGSGITLTPNGSNVVITSTSSGGIGNVDIINLSVQAAKLPNVNFPLIDAAWQAWEAIFPETNSAGVRATNNASWQFMVPTNYSEGSLKLLINYSLNSTNGPNDSNVVWGASVLSIRSGTTNDVHTNVFGSVVKGSNTWIAKYDGTNIVTNLFLDLGAVAGLQDSDLAVIKLERYANEDTYGQAVALHGLQVWYTNTSLGGGGGDITLNGMTNIFSATLSNATIKPLVVGVGDAAGATNSTGEIRGLEAGSNITLTPNGSNYVIAATGGSSSLATNANQFGAQVTLTIKDGAFLTNLNVESSLQVSNGHSYFAGPVTNLTQLNLPHLTVSRSAVINSQGDVTNSSADANWSLYPTNVWNSRQGGSLTLTNLAGTGAITNLFSLSLSNATLKPIVFGGVGTAAAMTNTTGQIYGLEAGGNVTITPNGSNLVIAASVSGSGISTNGNQFGASVELTIKDGPLLTNTVNFGAGFRGAVTNIMTAPQFLGTNVVFDGSLSSWFQFNVASGPETNYVFTNIQAGQTIRVATFVTNGSTVRVWANTTEIPASWYVGNNGSAWNLNSNAPSVLTVTRDPLIPATNVMVWSRDLEVVAGSGMTFTTNFPAGTVTFASTGGSGSLTTNANQFGAQVILTIKDGAFLTNVNIESSLQVSNGHTYLAGPVTNLTQLNLPHLTVSRSAVINAQGDVTNSSADANWSLYPTNVWNSRQGGSLTLTNLAGTGALTNLFSPTLSNGTIKPLVVGVGNAAGATNTTGEIRGLEAGTGITITPNGSNYVLASTASGSSLAFTNQLWLELKGNDATGARNDPSKPFQTLTNAIAAAIPGDVINIGVGKFTNFIQNGVVVSNGVSLKGVDWNNTVLCFTNKSMCIVPQDNVTIENLKIELVERLGTVTCALFGVHESFHSFGFTNVNVRGVRMKGYTDGIIVSMTANPVKANFYDCDIESNADLIVQHGNANNRLYFKNCNFYTHDPLPPATSIRLCNMSAGLVLYDYCSLLATNAFNAVNGGTNVTGFNLLGGRIRAENTTMQLYCDFGVTNAVTGLGTHRVEFYNCMIKTNNMTANVYVEPQLVYGVAPGSGITTATNSSGVVTVTASGGGGPATNAFQFGANTTLTIKDSAMVTNLQNIGVMNITNPPGWAGSVRLWATNGLGYTELMNRTNQWIPTNQFIFSVTNPVAGQVLRFNSVTIAGGVAAVVLTNETLTSGGAPGGLDGSVQFNQDGTTFAGTNRLYYDRTNESLISASVIGKSSFVATNPASSLGLDIRANFIMATGGDLNIGADGNEWKVESTDGSFYPDAAGKNLGNNTQRIGVMTARTAELSTSLTVPALIATATVGQMTNLTQWTGTNGVIGLAISSNGLTAISMRLDLANAVAFRTNQIDLKLNQYQAFTASLKTNLVWQLTNCTEGVTTRIDAYGAGRLGGAASNAWNIVCTAPTGVTIYWPPGITNGNYDVLVNSNQVVSFTFMGGLGATNILASYRILEGIGTN